MKSVPQFREMKQELYREEYFGNMSTLCFDMDGVLIKKVNLDDIEHFNKLRRDSLNLDRFAQDYVLVYTLGSRHHQETNQDQSPLIKLKENISKI